MKPDIHNTLGMLKDIHCFYNGNKKILFIDSDEASYVLVSELLADYNVEIIHAQSGSNAIRLFRQNPFIDTVITELKVPELDGFEILKKIKEINPLMPVIVQTASADYLTRQRCFKAGFNEYILKPIDLDLFIKILTKYISIPQNKN